MNIVSLIFRFSIISHYSDNTSETEIPLEGENRVIIKTTRSSYETKICKYRLPEDAADRFRALISKYNVAGWIGRTPALPKIIDSDGSRAVCSMVLMFDDGTAGSITFRETDEETGKAAQDEFRKLVFGLTKDEDMISSEMKYPTLKECRQIKEEHGPVAAVETSHFSMGMMYGSNQTVTQIVEKTGDDKVRVTVKKKAGNEPEASDSREIESDIFRKIQAISDRENLPGWHYACIDPSIPVDRSMMPMDYSSHSSLTVVYDDSLITGAPCVRRTIGESARKMGGADVDREISELVGECVADSEINVAMPQPAMMFKVMDQIAKDAAKTPSVNAFAGMNQALNTPWTCKACGQAGVTGKFCYNCGNPRS